MTPSRHTTDDNIDTEQHPSTASPPKRTATRSLADDLEVQPVVNNEPPNDKRPITPGQYLIRRFPALAEKYGAPLVEAYSGKGDNQSLVIRSEEHTSELQSLRHLVCR